MDHVELDEDESPLGFPLESEGDKSKLSREKHFSVRAVVVGLLVGGLMCFSNMYFGLQTGWVTMGSLQSTLLGFGVFRLLRRQVPNFGPLENVILQTTAVATATMPLAGGFVGIIPALSTLGVELGTGALILWSLAVCFFGVFFAVPLRKQTILREKLKFPSGTATAYMIKMLHKQEQSHDDQERLIDEIALEERLPDTADDPAATEIVEEEAVAASTGMGTAEEWKYKWRLLLITFGVSSGYMLVSYFVPVLRNLPLFTWLGMPSLTQFSWTLTPSLSYVGQGMIMGGRTGLSMAAGTVVGWAFLAPLAWTMGWAPGPIGSFQDGARGWILWISLSIMFAESMTSLAILVFKLAAHRFRLGFASATWADADEDPAPADQQVPLLWWTSGLVVSSVACVAVVSPLFGMPFYEPLIAVVVALLVSVLAVRALGETDLNPVSGVGKISQIVFAGVAPGNVVSNVIAGAIAEAGAQQAGDMMQDLKTGHLLRASPRAQFYGQMIGSFFSVFFAVAAYALYTSAYEVPGPQLPAPTAQIWIDMAKLVNGGTLAENVLGFCIGFAVFAGALPLLELWPRFCPFLPSGIAFAVAMYVTPNYTIPRVVGGCIQWFWKRRRPESHNKYMIVVASGFVLGEGIVSIVDAVMRSAGVPALTCLGCSPKMCGGC
eukprot:TRINITY_DN1424_c0_g1_i1.p1 TRINITY_DN1424_c0_g1~~TRINITY_DN1424_c0_g1_i1.p1  ORF type:complete len:663 (-),score=185.50 TRINITY_DN1424_c0_g1_i1:463-2451(-)